MFEAHYPALLVGYAVALGGWFLAARFVPHAWPVQDETTFSRPWLEFGLAFLAGAGVLVLGQLWSAGIRFPETGPVGPLAGALNQLVIFAPLVWLPLYRKHGWSTAWLPASHLAIRLAVGAALAALALIGYSLVRADADAPWQLAARVVSYSHVDELVQVFLEDVVIAILFVRLAATIGGTRAVGVVAALFAAGHIPAMLSQGASVGELLALVRDAAFGVAAISVLRRSRDIIWFWPVHFVMDMTQFEQITFGA